jgi:hypothetical protein
MKPRQFSKLVPIVALIGLSLMLLANASLADPSAFRPVQTNTPVTLTPRAYLPFVSRRWSPWTLEDAIARLPEVYTDSLTPETVEQYSNLLAPLPEEVQRWIVGMGWGLEDLMLDANEVALMQLLADKNVPTSMSLLTNPAILGGVDASEVTWAQDYQVESLLALLQPDIEQLVQIGLLSEDAVNSITELTTTAAHDIEIAKALHLMASFGHPDEGQFQFTVPDYNVVMYVFGQLVDGGIPQGYELVALAAALDYGTVYAIGNSEVRTLAIDYAQAVVSYVAETDQIVSQQGVADWQARNYTLEADINLVWGAPEKVYLWTEQPGQGWWEGWAQFIQRPMEAWEFDWLFTSISSLTAMRDWMIGEGFLDHTIESDPAIENDFTFFQELFSDAYDDTVDRVVANLNDYFYIGDLAQGQNFSSYHFDYQFEDNMIIVDGVQVHNQKIANPDWEWLQFTTTGKLLGVCVDNAYMEAILARSLNVSSNILARLQMDGEIAHVVPLYLNPGDGLWRATVYDSYLLDDSPESSPFHYGSSQIPLSSDSVPERVLFGLVANSADYTVQRQGIPSGYVYRRAPNLRQPGTAIMSN